MVMGLVRHRHTNRESSGDRQGAILRWSYLACVCLHVFYYLSDANQTLLLRSIMIGSLCAELRTLADGVLVSALVCIALGELMFHKVSNIKRVVVIGGCAYTAFLCAIHGEDSYLLMLFWLIAACPSSVSERDVLKALLVSGASICLLTVMLSLIGDIADTVRFEHGVLRHALGFYRDFYFSANASMLISVWMYLQLHTWKPINYAIVFSLGLVVFTISNGRVIFAVLMLQLLGIALWRLAKGHGALRSGLFRLARRLTALTPLALLAISILFGVFVDAYNPNLGPLNDTLNPFLLSRVSKWNVGIAEKGISLFGCGERPSGTFDNTYLASCVKYGMLFTLLSCLLIFVCCRILSSEDDFYLLLFIFTLSCVGFTMRYVDVPAYNFTLLLIAVMLAKSDEQVARGLDR